MTKYNQMGWKRCCVGVAVLLLMNGCQKVSSSESSDFTSSLQSSESETSAMSQHDTDITQTKSIENTVLPRIEPLTLSKSDLNTEWDKSAVKITLKGNEAVAEPSGAVDISGGVITIHDENTYVFEGNLEDGSIVVEMTDDNAKAHLVFNGVDITSKRTSPLMILNADKTILTLSENTVNVLRDTKRSDKSDFNAAMYSKDDLTINGAGSLTIEGNQNNGIQCSNDLKLLNCNLVVNAVNHGVRGDDSVAMKAANLMISSGGDGIKTKTEDKDGKGNITLEGGDVTIIAAQDAIDSAVSFYMTDGTLNIKSGGGCANVRVHHEEFGGWGRQNEHADFDETQSTSCKGVKAGTMIAIQGGQIVADCEDDALHADDAAYLFGKSNLTLSSGDDGVHADTSLVIAENATICVVESYEGLEAYCIRLEGGETHITARDDGVNASGESDSTNTDEVSMQNEKRRGNGPFGGFGGMSNGSGELYLSGGYLYVNADGDGLDSNGDITMTGGTVIVCGPTNDGNGPLDCGDNQNTITVTGGVLMAVGSTGMMETPDANYIASASLNAPAGTLIAVTDDDGVLLGAMKTPKEAKGIVFSANGMVDGYHVYTGGELDGSFNSDDWADEGTYTAGNEIASGNGGNFGMGGHGGFRPNDSDGFERPTPPDGNPMPPDGFEGQTPPDGNPMPPNGFDGQMPLDRPNHRPDEHEM